MLASFHLCILATKGQLNEVVLVVPGFKPVIRNSKVARGEDPEDLLRDYERRFAIFVNRVTG